MIRNIIFDLGGVLLKLDRDACIKAYNDLGYNGFDKVLSEFHQSGFFMDYEKGLISSEEFRILIKEHCEKGTSDESIDMAMGSFLIGIPVEKIRYIYKLRERFRTYVLSNTNPVAMDYVRPMFNVDGLDMEDFFDKIYLSYKMKLAKPDPEVYKYVLNDSGLTPGETLFIDDSPINLKAAEEFGIKTLLIDSESDFENEIENALKCI